MVSHVSPSSSDKLFVYLIDSFSMDKAQGFQAIRGDCHDREPMKSSR